MSEIISWGCDFCGNVLTYNERFVIQGNINRASDVAVIGDTLILSKKGDKCNSEAISKKDICKQCIIELLDFNVVKIFREGKR